MNGRNRWAKIHRTTKARETTIDEVAVALGQGQVLPASGPWCVRLTRVAPMKVDDDNLGGALKSIQDTIAEMLGVDDGSPEVRWDRQQTKDGAFFGVNIEVWNRAMPGAR